MTATTLQQTEGTPAAYPDPPPGLSAEAAALDADIIWQRIEAYTAVRYTSRTVQWIVDGCGDWQPPLKPATISTVERWTGEAWEVTELLPSPLGGYQLPGGVFRFAGTVGGGTVPASVNEAFRRLAEYSASERSTAGAQSETISVPDVATETLERSPAWMAKALQNSGAADLLRNYRRA